MQRLRLIDDLVKPLGHGLRCRAEWRNVGAAMDGDACIAAQDAALMVVDEVTGEFRPRYAVAVGQ